MINLLCSISLKNKIEVHHQYDDDTLASLKERLKELKKADEIMRQYTGGTYAKQKVRDAKYSELMDSIAEKPPYLGCMHLLSLQNMCVIKAEEL